MLFSTIEALVVVYLIWVAWQTKKFFAEIWDDLWEHVDRNYPFVTDNMAAKIFMLGIWIFLTFFGIFFYAPASFYRRILGKQN